MRLGLNPFPDGRAVPLHKGLHQSGTMIEVFGHGDEQPGRRRGLQVGFHNHDELGSHLDFNPGADWIDSRGSATAELRD